MPSAWLHLAVLWTFAFAQPLFQLFADSPEFLIVRGNSWPDVLITSLALVLLPPTAMVMVEAVASRWRPPLGRLTHLAFVALLTTALAIQVGKDLLGPGSLIPLLALGVGVGTAVLDDRGPVLPSVLTVLSPAPVIVLVWFLGISPVSELAWHGQDHSAGTRAPVATPVPVVLVIFDELSGASLMRGHAINSGRYPSFAGLARRATWYPNATTVEDNTVRAVPAILTGRYVRSDALPIASDQPPSIFDHLAGQYRFHVHEPVTHLCTDDLCPRSRSDWPQRAEKLVRSMGSIMRRRLLTEQPSEFLGFPSDPVDNRPEDIREYASGIKPGRTLNLIHMVLPHSPYWYDPSGRRYTTEDTLPGLTHEHWGSDAQQVADAEATLSAPASVHRQSAR